MTRSRVLAAVLVGVGALSLAACGDGNGDGGDGNGDGGGNGAEDTTMFCESAREVAAESAEIDLQDPSALQQVIDLYAELEQAAPDEVRGDIAILREALERATQGDVQAPFTADVQAASNRFNTFVTNECGITPPST